MRDDSKLLIRATIIKRIQEEYVLDCTGMTMSEVQDYLTNENVYIEDQPDSGWELVHTEELDSAIDRELEIQ
jgi:hypothetical protein